MSASTDRDRTLAADVDTTGAANSGLSDPMFYNRYSHLELDVYPVRISNNSTSKAPSISVRNVLDTAGRCCTHVDWEQCEERRVQELEEVSLQRIVTYLSKLLTSASKLSKSDDLLMTRQKFS